MSKGTPRILPVVFALLVAAVALSASARAAQPCWQTVINDWADNQRVDGRYPIHCYRDALRNLPEDMRAYSSAPDDIERAMRAEMLRQAQESQSGASTADPGASSAAGDSDESGGSGKTQGRDAQREQVAPLFGAGEPDPDDDRDQSGGILRQALDEIGPGDATSVPLPLLVLAGLLGLLMIAGGLGYVARRGAPGRLRIGRR